MDEKKLTISVVIPTRNRKQELMRCLDSLFAQTVNDFELVIVDSSDKPLEDVLAQAMKKSCADKIAFKYIYSAQPGLTLQKNLGVKESRGDIIVFLDDDTVLETDYLLRHRETYENKGLGQVMGCSGVFLGEKPYHYLNQLYRKIFLMIRPGIQSRVLPSGFYTLCAFDFISSEIKEVELCAGGNTSYRKEVFQHFSFDEGFAGPGPMEDADFSYRVSKKLKLIVNPQIRLYHYTSSLNRSDMRQEIIRHVFYHWRFVWKNLPQALYIWAAFFWSETGNVFYDLIKGRLKACLYRIEALLLLATGRKIES